MGIWLVLAIWMLFSGIFVWAICTAASRPIPQPATANVKRRKRTHARFRRSLPVISSLACVLLAGLLWSGCAASRSYRGTVHGLTFNGTVQSIDLQNHRLTLAPPKASEPVVFVWDATTKFWQNGIPIRPDGVELGRSVRIHYHESSGQFVAHHVYVQVSYAPLH